MTQPTRPLYASIAVALQALHNARSSDLVDTVNEDRWECYLKQCENALPHGGGFDLQPRIETDCFKKDRIFLVGDFHPIDASGGYRPWIRYTVTVTPSLSNGFYLRVRYQDRDLRELIYEDFASALAQEWPALHFFEKESRRCLS